MNELDKGLAAAAVRSATLDSGMTGDTLSARSIWGTWEHER